VRLTKRQLRKIINEELNAAPSRSQRRPKLQAILDAANDAYGKVPFGELKRFFWSLNSHFAIHGKIMETKMKITLKQLRKIIKEEGYYADLPKGHIEGQPWPGTPEDLAHHQGRAWGHGEVVDPKEYKGQVDKSRRLAKGQDNTPLEMCESLEENLAPALGVPISESDNFEEYVIYTPAGQEVTTHTGQPMIFLSYETAEDSLNSGTGGTGAYIVERDSEEF
tara:strand:+ start:665 stop:1330 length:666 start_codon:yes stop_codon:yes gene_type:complete